MKIASLNRFLLANFAHSETFGNDLESFFKRFRILCNIYANFALIFIVGSYNVISGLTAQNSDAFFMPLICFPMIGLSLFLLTKKYYNWSSIFLLLTMASGNLITTYNINSPIAALASTVLLPHFMFYSSPSGMIQILNLVICVGLHLYSSFEVHKIFRVTLSDEQALQINLLFLSTFLTLTTTSLFCIFHKSIEINIRRSTDLNFLKIENVTKEVVEVMRTKDAFVSMLSHEMRNPLNALKGSLDYLSEVVKDATSSKLLSQAKLSSEILLNLVNNVLDAAKLKSDKMDIICEETQIMNVVKKAMTINSKALKDKNLFAHVLIDERFPQKIWIDPSRLLQIFMNLISNAVKFTPPNGKINVYVSWCGAQENRENLLSLFKKGNKIRPSSLETNSVSAVFNEFSNEETLHRSENFKHMGQKGERVSLGLLRRDSDSRFWSIESTKSFSQGQQHAPPYQKGYLKIQITDTGCGIPEESIPNLFGMFEQVAQNRRSEHGGTGLGLWICKQLCQRMNGDITIYSQLNKGTSFVFYLAVNNEKIGDQLGVRRLGSSPKNEIRALVVDDQSVNCYLLALLLEREGIKVQTASSGKEAVEKYINAQRNGYFNFILMDVAMPEVDGFTAANSIRSWEAQNNKPEVDIYFVSGEYYHEEDILAGFRRKQGKVDNKIRFLKKPVDGDVLKKKVLSRYKLKND